MTRKARPNPYRAKIHHSYSVAEMAKLYGVHRNTVRAWMKVGLKCFQLGREHFVLGAELRDFLLRTRRKGRVKTPPGQIYCLKCRVPQAPAGGLVEVVGPPTASLNIRAICGDCSSLMHRRVSVGRLEESGFADLLAACGLAPRR